MGLISEKTALEILKNESVVAIPTETVYGLAASIKSEKALREIFAVKERPFFDPLIVHVGSLAMAKELTEDWNRGHELLAQEFWPGPLTLVVKKNKLKIHDLITSGLETVGLRMPRHPVALGLIEKLGIPLAAPSANKFKKTSPTCAEHVLKSLPEIPVIDGGPCTIGLESTILEVLKCDPFHKEIELCILRPGMISREKIEKVLAKDFSKIKFINPKEAHGAESPLHAPGMLQEHYCPKIPLILWKGSESSLQHFLKEKNLLPQIKINLPQEAYLAARVLYGELQKNFSEDIRSLSFLTTSVNWESEDWTPLRDRLTKASYKINE